jgi:hypothetical protein
MMPFFRRSKRAALLSRFFTKGARRLHLAMLLVTIAGAAGFVWTKKIWASMCDGAFYHLGLGIIGYQLAMIAGLCFIGVCSARAPSREKRLQVHRLWVCAGAVIHGAAGPITFCALTIIMWPQRQALAGDVAIVWLICMSLLEIVHAYAPRGPVRAAVRIVRGSSRSADKESRSR